VSKPNAESEKNERSEGDAAGKPPIYFVAGSKGGVGKSLVSMAVIDHLQRKEQETLLVETDTSNPDVWKAYREETRSVTLNLDGVEGWIELVNACAEEGERAVVVNTAARNNEGVVAHGDILQNTLGELNRELVTLWVVNEQRDSLELLREYLERVKTRVFVVKNQHFGRKFEIYPTTRLKGEVEARGGKDLWFPELAARVADCLYSRRLTIGRAMKELPLGDRAELQRWRNACAESLAAALSP